MDSTSRDWRVESVFVSNVKSLAKLRRFLGTALEQIALCETPRDCVILAAHETATNLIRHVLKYNRDLFVVAVGQSNSELTIEFHYVGPDFDPQSVPPPEFDGSQEGGFGLYLIASCVDSVTYDRVNDTPRTHRVTLIRRLEPDQYQEIGYVG